METKKGKKKKKKEVENIISLAKNQVPREDSKNNQALRNVRNAEVERMAEVISSWKYGRIRKRSEIILIKKSNKRPNEISTDQFTTSYNQIDKETNTNNIQKKLNRDIQSEQQNKQ